MLYISFVIIASVVFVLVVTALVKKDNKITEYGGTRYTTSFEGNEHADNGIFYVSYDNEEIGSIRVSNNLFIVADAYCWFYTGQDRFLNTSKSTYFSVWDAKRFIIDRHKEYLKNCRNNKQPINRQTDVKSAL